MDLFKLLCESNNEAAALMTAGEIRKAFIILQKATKLACQALSSLEEDDAHWENDDKSSYDEVIVSSHTNDEPHLKGNVFLLPFVIHEPRFDKQTLRMRFPAICAVLTYNMAICSHRFFYSTNDLNKQQQAISKAKILYCESADILQHVNLSGSLGQLSLGICNNMFEIAFEDGNLTNIERWYSMLCDEFQHAKIKDYNATLCRVAFRSVVYYSGRIVAARAA